MGEIIRVFHARTRDGKSDELRKFFVNEALPLVRSCAGLVSVRVGLPLDASPDSFLMISIWSSIEGLKEFADDDWAEAVIDPREAHLLASVSVYHYGDLDE